jgi:hypothetical protein
VSSLRSLRLRPRLGLGVLAGFLVAIPLTLLALSVRAGWDPVRDVDRGVADGLHGMVAHESWAVAALKVIAIALHPWVFRSAVLVLVLVLLSRRAYRLAWWAAITMTAGSVLGFVLKLVVARARPSFDTPTATAPGFSFPSGHALNSAVAVLVFLLVILPALPGTSARVAAWVVGGLIVFITGFDRVALGFTTSPMCSPGGWSRPRWSPRRPPRSRRGGAMRGGDHMIRSRVSIPPKQCG